MNALRLVDARAQHLPAVMAVMADTFDPEFGEAWTQAQCAGILPMPGVWMTLAERDGVPVGFSIARVVVDEAELLLLGVRRSARGRGVGGALLSAFCDAAQTRGARRVHLEMRRGNGAAAMYGAAGFEQVGRRPNYYRGLDGQCYDALTLSRAIA